MKKHRKYWKNYIEILGVKNTKVKINTTPMGKR
jgi:hypothetical protein